MNVPSWVAGSLVSFVFSPWAQVPKELVVVLPSWLVMRKECPFGCAEDGPILVSNSHFMRWLDVNKGNIKPIWTHTDCEGDAIFVIRWLTPVVSREAQRR